MKNSNNNNIILGFSFMYLVSVYPTNRTYVEHRYMNKCQNRISKPHENQLVHEDFLSIHQDNT